MSQDFEKILVLDSRISGCTDKLKYAVKMGGQNMTPQPYRAISESTSSVVFNIQVPSEQTLCDRRVLWRATGVLKFDFPAGSVPVGSYPINYGSTDALAPFPLHQLCSVQSVTINNNTVSLNTKDLIPALMRMNDKRELMRYNGMCPNMFDTYGNYSDGVGSINNPLGAYTNVGDNDLLPRGSFSVNSIYAGSPSAKVPQKNDGSAQTVYVEFTSTEPLLISPFIWANPETNCQAMYGLINMNAVFNISTPNRVWRSASPWMQNATITLNSLSPNTLLMNLISCHPSTLLPSRNIVNYYSLPRFITNVPASETINPPFVTPVVAGVNQINPLATGTQLATTNLQLNMVPDKLIIYVRKALGDQTVNDTDSFLAIRGISINFNNQSGILSSSSVADLYRYSVESGSNQSFSEFYGLASVASSNASAGVTYIPTTGSLLCLSFADHIQIADSYYAPGSLGNFQLQINLNVVDQFAGSNKGANGYEIVVVTVNSGLFALERGTASSYQGILTRSDVLATASQEAYSGNDIKRMVGCGFEDTLNSVTGKVGSQMKASGKSDVLSSLGYGRSGGGMSAGGMSGGSKHKLTSKFL
jgi:hypothetical protein